MTGGGCQALHVIAITCGRIDPETRAYLQRKEAEGKRARIEAMRCLKRYLRTPLPPATTQVASGALRAASKAATRVSCSTLVSDERVGVRFRCSGVCS
jgi:hypothetical protein